MVSTKVISRTGQAGVYLALGLPVLVLFLFWTIYAKANAAQGAFEEALPVHPPPPLLNGLLFAPDGIRSLPVSGRSAEAAQSKQRVAFVFADSCPACARQADVWVDFISTASLSDTALQFFVLDGDGLLSRLANAARARGVAFDAFAVADKDDFMLSTGITSTPRLLLLSEDDRVRFVTTQLTESASAVVAELLAASGGRK
jgi:hypothetical protein